ncbi:unnamed protein product [Spirodela intermedia]|uniref:F-box domain-containing protein n=1 Tax=Spirodela intermedia TaxID=51605 RepID=A0A7I8ILY3_SPIIN|nr:unnamed protein product [Spirodela intermedia]CAA6658845.1 unnamed protein product [Spirodela intermedia]
MIPDALGLIFRKLPLEDVLTVVPSVCKSWRRAVAGPYCWQEIDIDQWCQGCNPELIGRMLQMLIPRSSGSLRRLCVSGILDDQVFHYIADNAGSLRALELPRSEISDGAVEQAAAKLANVTLLDVSYCVKMGAAALEAFGKNCTSLVGLRRVMHPLEAVDRPSQDDEAHAIAAWMPKLRRLEMAYSLLTDAGAIEILPLDQKLLRENFPRLKVSGPLMVGRCEDNHFWDDDDDFDDCGSDSSGHLPWGDAAGDYYDGFSDADAEWDLDGLEVRFYGGGFEDASAALDWPPSP